MNGAIPPLPNTPPWHGAQLKHRNDFYLTLNKVYEGDRTRLPRSKF
jgi:hypothetical protein